MKPVGKHLFDAALEALAKVGTADDFAQLYKRVGGDLQGLLLTAARADNAAVVQRIVEGMPSTVDTLRRINAAINEGRQEAVARMSRQPGFSAGVALVAARKEIASRVGIEPDFLTATFVPIAAPRTLAA